MQLTIHQAGDSGANPVARPARARPWRLRYCDAAPATLDAHTLACVDYGRDPRASADPRRVHVALDLVDGPGAELWTTPLPVRTGWDHGIGWAETDEILFGQLRVPEAELAHGHIDRSVFHAYAIIDGFLRRRGFGAWLRVWNYLAHINQGEGDAERYRQFSLGRYKALALKPGFERELPAATAIGSYDGGLLIYFLAGRAPGAQVENPRQVSAFQYPREYGPRSPSFSRAVLMPWADGPELLVSGTASVVGHRTLHHGDAAAQLEETLANLQALLDSAEARLGEPAGFRASALKLYVRDPAVAPAARARLARAFPGAALQTLHGDVCRQDLALEVEAVFLGGGRA